MISTAQLLEEFSRKIEPHGNVYQREPPEVLENLERALGAPLPKLLVTILARHGACGFAGFASVDRERDTAFGVFTLFGASEILKDREAHPEYGPKHLVPIADDEFNNRFVVELSTGKVYFIDYSHASGGVTEVAKSFDEFIERIRVSPD